MSGKRRSRKKRGSRSITSKTGAEKRTDDRSFGSGLDEIGFRPLGLRIPVSRRQAQGERAQTTLQAEAASPKADNPVPSTDDPSGYDARDSSWVRKAAEDSLAGADKEAIEKEVDATLCRSRLRQGPRDRAEE